MHDMDVHLQAAAAQVDAVTDGRLQAPQVRTFFDEQTFTASHGVSDPATGRAAIVDSVWNFDQASGRTSSRSADEIIAYVREEGLSVDWVLETHAHADHLSAASYLQEKLGGSIAIGREIITIQGVFGTVFNEGAEFARDGSQFDRLLTDGDTLELGDLTLVALHVPGHTPADIAYVVGDAVFVGDTMFMPDYGSARTDFPGGDARDLYRSVKRLMQLPDATRVFLCHDYKAPGRGDYAWETTIAAERLGNVHLHDGVTEEEFVAMRTKRDATLSMPKLILPSLQVNIRGGRVPEPDTNGVSYLRLPLNLL